MADDTTTTDAPAGDADAAEETEPVEVDERREELLGRFTEALGDAVVDSHILAGKDLWIRVSTEAWATAADVARNRLRARYFGFLSVIDWMPSPYGRSMDAEVDRAIGGDASYPESGGEIVQGYAGGETRFQVFARVAQVGVPGDYWGVTLKADVPDEPFQVDSWTQHYAGADWHEREAWEMFGVDFVGHPGLRHMYLPSDFEGNPMRKDYPLVARLVKPWPGIVDVEPMPTDESEDEVAGGETAAGDDAAAAEGGES
ncbi:MAG: NADH-quinone oxidoreductase subunit C [Microthrixaceae bacterium]